MVVADYDLAAHRCLPGSGSLRGGLNCARSMKLARLTGVALLLIRWPVVKTMRQLDNEALAAITAKMLLAIL